MIFFTFTLFLAGAVFGYFVRDVLPPDANVIAIISLGILIGTGLWIIGDLAAQERVDRKEREKTRGKCPS